MASKRANNEGTLYFREDRKRWCAQVCLDGRRLTSYARKQTECRDWIRETLAKISNGLTFKGTQITLKKFVYQNMPDYDEQMSGDCYNRLGATRSEFEPDELFFPKRVMTPGDIGSLHHGIAQVAPSSIGDHLAAE